MNGVSRRKLFDRRGLILLSGVVFLATAGAGYRAQAAQPQAGPERMRIFDGKPRTIIVNGYSTSFKWPRLLQAKLDEFTGGKRVLSVKPATKGGTPIAKWMDIETGKPGKPWLEILRPKIQDGDEPVIVLAQQSLQWCFGQRTEGIRDDKDAERIKRGADILEKYARLLKDDGADLVFVAMHIYKHPMEPEIGNERLALAELLKRKIPNVHAGPDVWKPTKARYPKAFADDKVHPNDEGAEIMAFAWFKALLMHDRPDPSPPRRPGEASLSYLKRIVKAANNDRSAAKGESDAPRKESISRRPGETTAAYTKRLADERAARSKSTARKPGETTSEYTKRIADERVVRIREISRKAGETTSEYTKRIADQRSKQSVTIMAKDIEYMPDGHERQKLDIYLPYHPGEGPLPLIIWIHGGAWRAGSKQNCRAKRFVAKGYAVASINYRLSQHAIFPAQIEDCKAAVRYLRANAEKYGFDPERFGVWGSSAGGHLVALLGTTGDVKDFDKGPNPEVSSRVQAVCDYFGPTDFTKMSSFWTRMDHDASDSPESKLIGGAVQENRDKCKRANPVTYITKDDPPFLIVHGDKDPLVPHNQSVILHEALQKAGVKVKFHTVPGGGHGGFRDPAIDEMVDEFFEKTLRPGGKPD